MVLSFLRASGSDNQLTMSRRCGDTLEMEPRYRYCYATTHLATFYSQNGAASTGRGHCSGHFLRSSIL